MDLLFTYHAEYQQFHEVDHETDQTVQQHGFRDIIARLLVVDTGLRALYENFEKCASGLLYWPEFSTLESRLDDAQLGKVFPISFHFPVFVVAQLVATYWATMMAVHHLLMWTYHNLSRFESSTTKTTDSVSTSNANGRHSAVSSAVRAREHSKIWKIMVWNICQSVEYFSKDSMGFSGQILMFTHLSGCKGCLESVPDSEDWSREIAWITDHIEKVQNKIDFPVDNLLGG
jgi:hypothetical protein